MTRRRFTQEELSLLRRAATTERLAGLVRSLANGRPLSADEVHEVRDAVGSMISVDRRTGEITEEGVAFDHLIERVAEVTGLWDTE